MADDLVDQLLAQTLPGRSGVMFDYAGISQNQEHAVLGGTSHGLALYTASIHAPVLMELRETETGNFGRSKVRHRSRWQFASKWRRPAVSSIRGCSANLAAS